jgi:hypothetical protein
MDKSHKYDHRYAVPKDELYQEMRQEQGVFSHAVDVNKFLPHATCGEYSPGIGNQAIANQGIRRFDIDTESVLRRQTQLASKCPEFGAVPWKQDCLACNNCSYGLPCNCHHCNDSNSHCKGKDGLGYGTDYLKPGCTKPLETEYTRLDTLKPCNLPGIFINRFEPLCEDPQDTQRIHSNRYIGVGTRNFITDMYSKLFTK